MKNSTLYQIKITLKHVRPPVWRRLQVPGSVPLSKLHRILQAAMGWQNIHLHHFIVEQPGYMLYFGVPSGEDSYEVYDERRFRLHQVAEQGSRLFYEYDFGDGWQHVIQVEKVLPPHPQLHSAVCLKGRRACPPEDVGGCGGYANFLSAMGNPQHSEHEQYRRWYQEVYDSETFNPESFDQEAANARLRRIRLVFHPERRRY